MEACLKSRVKLQHVTDILAILATHGWNRTESDDFANASLHNIVDHFAVPQTKAGADLRRGVAYFAKTYLDLAQDDS